MMNYNPETREKDDDIEEEEQGSLTSKLQRKKLLVFLSYVVSLPSLKGYSLCLIITSLFAL